MARGDILFYQGHNSSLADRLIMWRTHGPFTHVGVDMGDGTTIDARPIGGVKRRATDYAGTITYPLSAVAKPDDITDGLAWLELVAKERAPYSWPDILSFLPGVRHLRILFFTPHAFDCSHLVTQYLVRTGGVRLGLYADSPELVSPNDVARCAGIL